MAHIAIEEGIPGILGPMKFRPETTKPCVNSPRFCFEERTVSLRPNAKPSQRSCRPVTTAASASSPTALPRPSIWAETKLTTRS